MIATLLALALATAPAETPRAPVVESEHVKAIRELSQACEASGGRWIDIPRDERLPRTVGCVWYVVEDES